MSELDANTMELLKLLWHYNKIGRPPQAADFLLVLGTNDTAVAHYAASLAVTLAFRHVVVSGGVHHDLSWRGVHFGDTEARHFAAILEKAGINSTKIIIENAARNTGENVTLARALLLPLADDLTSGHLVHTPAMERRALATAERQWPEIAWSVSSPPGDFAADMAGADPLRFAQSLVGDTARILSYPAKGFQTAQEMPDEVRRALEELIALGFTKRLPHNRN